MIAVPSIPLNYSNNRSSGYAANYAGTNADMFQILLQQNMNNMMSSFNPLFNNEEENSSSSFFGSASNFLPSSNLNNGTDLFGQVTGQSSNTTNSPILEMIARSNLIGKTVEAVDPQTGSVITGKVQSVTYEGSLLLFDVGGKLIPPENLRKVSE
jgi:hypothetical protein